jgi:hypothetical protein
MPVAGRKPKPPGQAVHRNKSEIEWREVVNVPYAGESPDLPELTAHGEEWSAFARTWWRTIRSMPHCILWSQSDWLFAIATADLVSAYRSHAPEIRQREKILGTTDDARRDLRIRYIDAPTGETESGAKVTKLDDYRDL